MKIHKLDKIEKSIEQFIHRNNVPYLDITIASGASAIFSGSFGNCSTDPTDRQNGIYLVGSITKTITAFLTYQLVKEGVVSLVDPVIDHLPFLKKASVLSKEITLKHLLTHTSGINNEKFDWLNLKKTSLEMGISDSFQYGDYQIRWVPQDVGKFKYSNVGYDLLGALIELKREKPFTRCANDNVFEPLQMNQTFFDTQIGHDKRNRIPTATINGEICALSPISPRPRHAPSSTLFSSSSDLSKWASMNTCFGTANGTQFLSPADYQEIWKKEIRTGINYCPYYGLGWFTGKFSGKFAVGHGGRVYGYNSLLLMFPESGISIVILMNTQNADVIKLGWALARLLINK